MSNEKKENLKGNATVYTNNLSDQYSSIFLIFLIKVWQIFASQNKILLGWGFRLVANGAD